MTTFNPHQGGAARGIGAFIGSKRREKQQDLAGQLERAEKERKNIDDLIKFQKIADDPNSSPQMVDFARQGIALIGPTGGQQPGQQQISELAPLPIPRTRRGLVTPSGGTGPRAPIGGARSVEGIKAVGEIQRAGIGADLAVAEKRGKAKETSLTKRFNALINARVRQLFPNKSAAKARLEKFNITIGQPLFTFRDDVHGPLLIKIMDEMAAANIPVSPLVIADLDLDKFRTARRIGVPLRNQPQRPAETAIQDSALGAVPTGAPGVRDALPILGPTVGAPINDPRLPDPSTLKEGQQATLDGRPVIIRNGVWVEDR